MTIANCPRCCEQVTLPETASHEATVRCPLCQDEYSLAEALAQLPPALIVVADVGAAPAPVTADDDDSPWAALNLDDDDADEFAMAPVGEASSAGSLDFTSGSATTSSKAKAAIRPSTRTRKPKGSPVKSIVSIVIGGLLAFPIAQLILWYLPGDLKRDFGVGPVVAQYVPQIVPAKFRGSRAKEQSDGETSFQDSNVAGSDFNFGDTSKFDVANAGSRTNENPSGAAENANDAAPVNNDPPAEEEMSLEDAAAAGADVFGGSLEVPGLDLSTPVVVDEPAAPNELFNPSVEPLEEPALELPPLGDTPPTSDAPTNEVAGLAPGDIRNAPQVSTDDVVQSFQAALTGNLAWDTNEASSPSGALKKTFYRSFSELGEALTFADKSDERVVMQIAETAELLHQIGDQPDKLAILEDVANGWMKLGRDKRNTDGIALCGIVKSVKPIGGFYETTIETDGKEIAVVSMSDPSEHFVADQKVLVLGTILDQPAQNLGGYEGNREVVVLDGFHVNISAE